MRPENKLDRISERIYLWSFVLVAIVILGATTGNMIASYLLGANTVSYTHLTLPTKRIV